MSREPEAAAEEAFRAILEARAAAFELSPGHPALQPASRYLAELSRWAKAVNLTGSLAPQKLAGQVLEAIFASRFFSREGQLLDIGSGGGMPGIPLALSLRGTQVTLLEPRSRRASFLAHLVRTMPLENARVVVERLENLTAPPFDAATARAVGGLLRALSRSRFLKPDGKLLLFATASGLRRNPPPEDFLLEAAHPIPESREKVVAVFRMFHVEQKG
jgi:16S rRNA (guanine527-N7)-methyltransferase